MILFIDSMKYENNKRCNHKFIALGKLNAALFGNVVKSLYDKLPDEPFVNVVYSGTYSGGKPKLSKRLYKVQRELSGKIFAVFYYPHGVILRDKSHLNSYYGIEKEKYKSDIPVFENSIINKHL